MEDINVGCKPFSKNDKLIIEVKVTDVDKAFDFIGKMALNKIDTSHTGLEFDSASFFRDRYISYLDNDLRSDMIKEIDKAFNNINSMLRGDRDEKAKEMQDCFKGQDR